MMKVSRVSRLICAVVGIALFTAGCASNPQDTERREQVERDIQSILTEPTEDGAYGERRSCLSTTQYRSFRALNDRYLLFEGSRNRLWLNRLFAPCPDLRHSSVLRVKSISAMGRICKMDSFQPGDWFDWPWYRRSPWRWGSSWSGGMGSCSLGEFQEVTPAQVQALERAISVKR